MNYTVIGWMNNYKINITGEINMNMKLLENIQDIADHLGVSISLEEVFSITLLEHVYKVKIDSINYVVKITFNHDKQNELSNLKFLIHNRNINIVGHGMTDNFRFIILNYMPYNEMNKT